MRIRLCRLVRARPARDTTPISATATITNMDQSMTESTALVTVELPLGGTPQYDVTFVRSDNHIGWVVSSFDLHYDEDTTASDSASSSDTTAESDAASSSTVDTAQGSASDGSSAAAE